MGKIVKTWNEPTVFGSSPKYGDALDLSMDVVVLCEWGFSGLKPIRICLPHQVYLEKLDPTKEYVVLPVKASDYIDLVIPKKVVTGKDAVFTLNGQRFEPISSISISDTSADQLCVEKDPVYDEDEKS